MGRWAQAARRGSRAGVGDPPGGLGESYLDTEAGEFVIFWTNPATVVGWRLRKTEGGVSTLFAKTSDLGGTAYHVHTGVVVGAATACEGEVWAVANGLNGPEVHVAWAP